MDVEKHIHNRIDHVSSSWSFKDYFTGLYAFVKYRFFGTPEQKNAAKYITQISCQKN